MPNWNTDSVAAPLRQVAVSLGVALKGVADAKTAVGKLPYGDPSETVAVLEMLELALNQAMADAEQLAAQGA